MGRTSGQRCPVGRPFCRKGARFARMIRGLKTSSGKGRLDFPRAFLKAQMGAGTILPSSGCAFLSIKDADKTDDMLEAAKILLDQGFTLVATRGTASWLSAHDLACTVVNKVYEGRPDVTDMMKDEAIHLVMNTTEGAQAVEDSKSIRSIALYDKIPYFTTAAGSYAAALAIRAQADGDVGVKALQG